ncbi:MAG: VOC family protein [Sphingomonadales bacterium]
MLQDLRVGRNRFIQTAFVVDDIDAAMHHWLKTYNTGPFYIMRHAQIEDLRYRGKPGQVDASFAMAQAGGIQIELCAQHNDGPSAYRDTFPKGQEGFHHMCSVTLDYDAEMAHFRALGFEPAMEGRFGEMRFSYLDTRKAFGFMTEVIEEWEPVRAVHQQVADAAQNWDGSDPIREL